MFDHFTTLCMKRLIKMGFVIPGTKPLTTNVSLCLVITVEGRVRTGISIK